MAQSVRGRLADERSPAGDGVDAAFFVARYGERWQLIQEGSVWVAVQLPPRPHRPCMSGYTPAELAAKLDAEEQP
jgi:hypothetical protein